jgi:hypothetical protein
MSSVKIGKAKHGEAWEVEQLSSSLWVINGRFVDSIIEMGSWLDSDRNEDEVGIDSPAVTFKISSHDAELKSRLAWLWFMRMCWFLLKSWH